MDSNSTRSRSDRLQLSVLLDAGLVVSLRSAARQRGMTIAALVEKALEVELDGYVDAGTGGGGGVAVQGGDDGNVGGRVGERGPVSPDSGRRVAPDWDAILAAAVEKKISTASSAYAPLVDAAIRETVSQLRDPIEEIA